MSDSAHLGEQRENPSRTTSTRDFEVHRNRRLDETRINAGEYVHIACARLSKKSKNTLVTSYSAARGAAKIPGSLIRLPTITSKRRRSAKLFHFITTSSFFFPPRRRSSFPFLLASFSFSLSFFLFLRRYTINFITLSSFDDVPIAKCPPFQSVFQSTP